LFVFDTFPTACPFPQVSAAQLYSHSPRDFDYKLASGELAPVGGPFRELSDLTAHIAATANVAFPVVHGRWGEDGKLAGLLEAAGVPFVGTPSAAAEVAFNKVPPSPVLWHLLLLLC
jgi:D-alanine-D-alanine ligase-like ATP-grasp enzyme